MKWIIIYTTKFILRAVKGLKEDYSGLSEVKIDRLARGVLNAQV